MRIVQQIASIAIYIVLVVIIVSLGVDLFHNGILTEALRIDRSASWGELLIILLLLRRHKP